MALSYPITQSLAPWWVRTGRYIWAMRPAAVRAFPADLRRWPQSVRWFGIELLLPFLVELKYGLPCGFPLLFIIPKAEYTYRRMTI